MTSWTTTRSTTHRFTTSDASDSDRVIELEEFDNGTIEVRAVDPENRTASVTREFDDIDDATAYIKAHWDIDHDAVPASSTVRVKRLVLSLLADYAGSDIVFGHDVPPETRDAVQAAYEALDEPVLPISLHDCPDDGAPLEPVDDTDISENEQRLKCRDCGDQYILDRDHGTVRSA